MLVWENTDQFGNLKVASSTATSLEDVENDLRDMAQAVFEQHGEEVSFSVDVAYSEISAPRGDQVSHVLSLPFVGDLIAGRMSPEHIRESLTNQLQAIVGDTARVVGPWD